MQEMTFKHIYAGEKQLHRIVYIEYSGKKVHAIVTDNFNGFQNHWDFEPDCKEVEMYMFYNSGSGGKITQLQAPHYAFKKSKASYWMHKDAKFKGKAINITRIDTPIEYNGDPNPFNNGREIGGVEYCKFCNKYYDEDTCPDHHVINDESGELEYMDGSKID